MLKDMDTRTAAAPAPREDFMNALKAFFRALRDPVSGLTHMVGAALAIAGLVLLLVESSSPAKPWHLVTFSIFGAP